MKFRDLYMKFGLTFATFLLGIFFHYLLFRAFEATHSEELILLIFAIFITVVLVALAMALTFFFQEVQQGRKEYDKEVLKSFEASKTEVISKVETALDTQTQQVLDQVSTSFLRTRNQHTTIKERIDQMCQTLEGGQEGINRGIEQLSNFLGLTVRFVGEDKGATYLESINLIKEAKKSLIFVDFWVQTNEYLEDDPPPERQQYYDAILEQIGQHQNDQGDIFHKRIIQLPELAETRPKVTVVSGKVFRNFALKCLEIQRDYPHATSFKVAPPSIQASFVIIDEKYMIWLILSYHHKRGNLARRGIIIFHDPGGEFIRRMMAIYAEIDSQAQRLRPAHLQGRIDN